jgi:RNA polymerase sigma-70 factor, ECF subfamily
MSKLPTPPIPDTKHEAVPTAAEAFRDYAPRIYHLARRMLGNEADAQDVTQEVFVQVMRKLSGFRSEAAFPTWLYRVAVNAALAYRRNRAVREGHLSHDAKEITRQERARQTHLWHWVGEPEKLALDRETHDLIEKAIARLPERYRDVYMLADLEELSNVEIAEMLGLGLSVVKSRLHRARLLMRAALTPYFEENGRLIEPTTS